MTIGRPRSAVAALASYRPGKGAVQAEKEHGIVDAIKLASNENPLPPIESVRAAVVDAASGINRYADHRAVVLRERLAESLSVNRDQITVGCGSVGLLQQLALTYVDPGDELVFPWLSFEAYPLYAQLAGGVAIKVPLAGYDIDLAAVGEAITTNTKLVFIATPNNPTGSAVSTKALAEMLDGVSTDTIVVIDEAYREFLDPSFGDPVSDLVPHFENVVVTRTMSKAHGLAGLRLGYAVGHPEVIAMIDRTLVPFAVNALAQAAALAVLDVDDQVRERVADIVSERDRVASALIEAGWELPDRQANFVYLATGERSDEVYLGLEKRGVVTRPFSGNGVRVTIGSVAENNKFLAALAEVVPS